MLPPRSPVCCRPLAVVPAHASSMQQYIFDGVIPEGRSNSADQDGLGLEFLLLRDSRHAIAGASGER
jgi:hypothetical protein